jgi:hypothetical protein
MSTRMASDEVTDDIAAIEMHRQGTEQESGLAVACSEALRKLQALLEQEKEALRVHGPDSVHAINVEAVANQIRRVQSMAGGRGQSATPRNARPRGPQAPRPEKPRNAPRSRGRRTMGRSGRSGGRGGSRGGGGGNASGGAGGGANS